MRGSSRAGLRVPSTSLSDINLSFPTVVLWQSWFSRITKGATRE